MRSVILAVLDYPLVNESWPRVTGFDRIIFFVWLITFCEESLRPPRGMGGCDDDQVRVTFCDVTWYCPLKITNRDMIGHR
jgi:hypothetical protein